MSREDIPWITVVILLLIGGFLIGQRFGGSSENVQVAPDPVPGEGTFRQWLWGNRTLDLAVQVGLILGGALGIAALLPKSREDDET